jgi:hypothetical protein
VLRRNRKPLSGILANCFSKRKKPNKICLGNQTKFSIFLRNNCGCMVVDPYKARMTYVCTRRKFPKKIWIQQENLYKINFLATSNKDTAAQLYCTLSNYITPKNIYWLASCFLKKNRIVFF